jgi:hypothetical protein
MSEWKNMKKPCKITVECVGAETSMPSQRDVWWDDEYHGMEEAISDTIRSMGGWVFRPIEGNESYRGWSRMTVNISDKLCVMAGCGTRKSDMNDDENICWDCTVRKLQEVMKCQSTE